MKVLGYVILVLGMLMFAGAGAQTYVFGFTGPNLIVFGISIPFILGGLSLARPKPAVTGDGQMVPNASNVTATDVGIPSAAQVMSKNIEFNVDPKKISKSPSPSGVSATCGIASILFMFISITIRLIHGTGRIGLTGYGERLYEHGLPNSIASALDFGQASELMIGAMFLGLIALLLGLIAVLRKGRKNLAVTGIVTGLFTVAPPLLLPLLL